jgi:hypothetical protein
MNFMPMLCVLFCLVCFVFARADSIGVKKVYVKKDGSGWNHEYNGFASQGNGSKSPLIRQLRKVYFMYKSLWGPALERGE